MLYFWDTRPWKISRSQRVQNAIYLMVSEHLKWHTAPTLELKGLMCVMERKAEALDRTLRRTRSARCCGLLVRQTRQRKMRCLMYHSGDCMKTYSCEIQTDSSYRHQQFHTLWVLDRASLINYTKTEPLKLQPQPVQGCRNLYSRNIFNLQISTAIFGGLRKVSCIFAFHI